MPSTNLLLIKGPVPGPIGGTLFIKKGDHQGVVSCQSSVVRRESRTTPTCQSNGPLTTDN